MTILKNTLLILFLFISQLSFSQIYKADSIPPELHKRFEVVITSSNSGFKSRYCPDIKEEDKMKKGKGYEYFYGVTVLEPKYAGTGYVFIIDTIEDYQWHNYFLVTKKGNMMHNFKDTVELETPCNKYFPYDDKFLVKYDNKDGSIKLCGGNI